MFSQISDTTRILCDTRHQCPTYGGRSVECRIRIIENRWNTVVIATDLSDSLYTSITLHTEELATSVSEEYGIDQTKMLWIEHIPARSDLGRNEDLYDLVHFKREMQMLHSPQWTPLSEEEITVLTDGVLIPVAPQ